MDLRRDDFKRTAHAPAKLNLFLEVLGRRDDGFHDLETLMLPIRIADSVIFVSSPPANGNRTGDILLDVRACWPVRSLSQIEKIPIGPDNLVIRSLELLRQRSGCTLGARVGLVKRIPAAAGLGGGSSDAAAALRLANRAWRIHWSDERLADLAAELGSDIPFFLSRGAAICRGRGERIERLRPITALHFVIVKPPVGLSTSEVYRAHDFLPEARSGCESGRLSELVGRLATGSWLDLGHWMQNRLQKAASSICPSVDKLRMAFDRLDFVGHQLSGSGSAYFGVCRHAQHARRLASYLRTRQLGLVYATSSCQ